MMKGIVFGCIVPHPPIIVPDVGKGGEREIAATSKAMEQLADKLAAQKPETVLIVSPHGKYHADAMGILTAQSSYGDMSAWGSSKPGTTYNNDLELVDLIQHEAKKAKVPISPITQKPYHLDWGVMVPMYFLNRALDGASLVPLTFSWLSLETHYTFGKAIKSAADLSKKRVAIIASGDLSHRLIPNAPAGYDPMGKIFDTKLADAISAMDTEAILNFDPAIVERAGECGLRSVVILLGALAGLNVQSKVLSYECPFGVGYMVASLEIIP